MLKNGECLLVILISQPFQWVCIPAALLSEATSDISQNAADWIGEIGGFREKAQWMDYMLLLVSDLNLNYNLWSIWNPLWPLRTGFSHRNRVSFLAALKGSTQYFLDKTICLGSSATLAFLLLVHISRKFRGVEQGEILLKKDEEGRKTFCGLVGRENCFRYSGASRGRCISSGCCRRERRRRPRCCLSWRRSAVSSWPFLPSWSAPLLETQVFHLPCRYSYSIDAGSHFFCVFYLQVMYCMSTLIT